MIFQSSKSQWLATMKASAYELSFSALLMESNISRRPLPFDPTNLPFTIITKDACISITFTKGLNLLKRLARIVDGHAIAREQEDTPKRYESIAGEPPTILAFPYKGEFLLSFSPLLELIR